MLTLSSMENSGVQPKQDERADNNSPEWREKGQDI